MEVIFMNADVQNAMKVGQGFDPEFQALSHDRASVASEVLELRAAMSMGGFGAIRASGMRLASFSLRCTDGSLRALIRTI